MASKSRSGCESIIVDRSAIKRFGLCKQRLYHVAVHIGQLKVSALDFVRESSVIGNCRTLRRHQWPILRIVIFRFSNDGDTVVLIDSGGVGRSRVSYPAPEVRAGVVVMWD